MIDINSLYASLVDASWRGITFSMPDSRDETGRRLQRIFFPGRDDTAFQDMGALDGAIRVTGIIIGDDYIERASKMRTALRTSGSGLLVHPWLGELVVVLTDPASITYSDRELRVARFEAVFAPFQPRTPAAQDTLGSVLSGIEDLKMQARALLAAILAPIALTLAVIGAVESLCSQISGIFAQVFGVDGTMSAAAAPPLQALLGVGTLPADATYPAAIAAALAAPSAAAAAVSATLLPAAIGPGDAPPLAVPVDPRITTAALVAAARQVLALSPAPAPISGVVLATVMLVLGDAVAAATDIAYTSQQDALVWLGQLTGALDAATTVAAQLATTQPATAGRVWQSAQRLRGNLAADINNAVGRLPAIQTLTLQSTQPVWLIAQGLAGDTPSRVLAMYADLVSRNGIVHPALAGPGDIEALVA